MNRVRAPEDTWDRIAPLLGVFGITRLADVTGLDNLGIPVVMAVRPLAPTLSVHQGKGSTLLLARVSAAMEAIEFHHAESACPPAALTSAADRLGLPYDVMSLDMDPGTLFTPATPVEWVEASGIVSGRPALVPLDCVRLPTRRRRPGLRSSTNGLASGNTVAEAALHGLYELLERQAVCQSFVDLTTVTDDRCVPLIDRIRTAGAYLEVAQAPEVMGVRCFLARVWSEDFPVMAAGSGAHSDPGIALSRAIAEAAQSRLTAITGTRDDTLPLYDRVRAGIVKPPEPPSPQYGWRGGVDARFDTVEDEFGRLARRVRRHTGSEPLLVELAAREEYAVVKVVAPGLST